MSKTNKAISIRMPDQELEVLKKLAESEVRTLSGWLRTRVIIEGQKAGYFTSANLKTGYQSDEDDTQKSN